VSALLLILLLVVLAAVGVVAAGYGDALGPTASRRGSQAELPPHPGAEDVDALRFSLGLRGYRMDEVDLVLDRLRDELAARDLRIAELEASMASIVSDDALYDQDAGYPDDAYVEDAMSGDNGYDEESPDPAAAGDPVTVRPPEKG
jgi:DivIVA domain-containing protein